jgi:cytochrome c-type biogenesis protein
MYEVQLYADKVVTSELQTLSPFSIFSLFGAGLLTSLTPCCLSMLPLTFAFLAAGGGQDSSSETSASSLVPGLAYTAGLACALAALGVVAASFGKVYGDAGAGATELLRAGAASLSIGMGLSLLQLLPVRLGLSSLMFEPERLGTSVPPALRAFLFGISSALVASPCASPVLVSILGFVATLGDPLLGGALLAAYTLGYTAPVLATSLAAGSARRLAGMEESFSWVQPAGGAFLVAYGTYNVLVATLGPV